MKKLFKIFIVLGLAIGLSTGIALADENILPDSIGALGEITLTDEGWGATNGYTETNDCAPDYKGWGDDWWILNLSTPRDVKIKVRDDFIVGDFYEVHVQPLPEGDDCIIGVTPKPEPGDPYSTGTFVVSLKAGSYLIRVRDAAFADDSWLCPAGYYVTIALSDYTDIPWPCGGFPGEAELEALEAKLDGLSVLPLQLDEVTRLINGLVLAVETLEAKSDAMEAKLDVIQSKVTSGEVVTQNDLAAGQGGVYFMGAEKQPKP